MKRSYLLISTIFTIFVTLFSLVTPALAKEPRSIKFISVEYWGSKGVVFKFQIKGNFSPSELKGFVRIGDKQFGLDCNFSDDDVLACVAGDSIGQYVGANAVIVLSGFGFYAQIPQRKEFANLKQYCYDVWGIEVNDLDAFNAAVDSGTDSLILLTDYTHPEIITNHCQDYPAKQWDNILFSHPQQAQIEQILGDLPGTFDEFPATFIQTIPPGYEGCFPPPSYHGIDSLFWHIFNC